MNLHGVTNDCIFPKFKLKNPINRYACTKHWSILPLRIKDKITRGFNKGSRDELWFEGHELAKEFYKNRIENENKMLTTLRGDNKDEQNEKENN